MSATTRLPYDASYARFIAATLGSGPPNPTVRERPRYDTTTGPSLFRTRIDGCALEHLELPGLFVGRSELISVSFAGSNIGLSTLCWNNFERCSFDESDLRDSDLRAAYFIECSFVRADLRSCDLRLATLRSCNFTEAKLDGAIATTNQRAALALTDEQIAVVDWRESGGDWPPGG